VVFKSITDGKNVAESNSATLLKLEGKRGLEYWLGLDNFYVITRYNHSVLYAMAVMQLSEKLKAGLMR
jgi:membrane-bound lytic murein transglycosylase B